MSLVNLGSAQTEHFVSLVQAKHVFAGIESRSSIFASCELCKSQLNSFTDFWFQGKSGKVNEKVSATSFQLIEYHIISIIFDILPSDSLALKYTFSKRNSMKIIFGVI